MSWAVAVCIDLTCVIAARERQRDQCLGITTRRLSWPAIVLAGSVVLSLAANLAQAHPDAWGQIVAAVPSVAFLVAASMIEGRAARRPQRAAVPGQDGGASDQHGQLITRDALRARLGVSTQAASDLLRQLRATQESLPPEVSRIDPARRGLKGDQP